MRKHDRDLTASLKLTLGIFDNSKGNLRIDFHFFGGQLDGSCSPACDYDALRIVSISASSWAPARCGPHDNFFVISWRQD